MIDYPPHRCAVVVANYLEGNKPGEDGELCIKKSTIYTINSLDSIQWELINTTPLVPQRNQPTTRPLITEKKGRMNRLCHRVSLLITKVVNPLYPRTPACYKSKAYFLVPKRSTRGKPGFVLPRIQGRDWSRWGGSHSQQGVNTLSTRHAHTEDTFICLEFKGPTKKVINYL